MGKLYVNHISIKLFKFKWPLVVKLLVSALSSRIFKAFPKCLRNVGSANGQEEQKRHFSHQGLLLCPCQESASISLGQISLPSPHHYHSVPMMVLRPSETTICEKCISHVEQQAGNIKMLITAWKNNLRLILNWMFDSIWAWHNLFSFWQWFQYAAICRIPPFSLKTSSCLDNIVNEIPGGEPYVTINAHCIPCSLPTTIFHASH